MQGVMAWASPSRLQDSVARYIAKKIVRYTETCIRSAIAKVPPELLDARATAGLLRHQYTSFDDDDNVFADDEVIGEATSHASGNRDQMNVMDNAMVMVKESLDKLQDWLSKIPKNLAGPRGSLEEAFDTYSDVHPKYDKDFPKHLTGLLIKLLVLGSVFIDRDYGDKDKLCVVPFAWESWVARLMRRIGPLYNLHELKVYGGIHPNILAAILHEAPNLKSLFISHINITEENLLVASKFCPKLEKLYLLHNFPWEVISTESLYAAFFRGTVRKDLAEKVFLNDDKSVWRNFTALKEVEVAYGQYIDAIDFHRLLLKYYPEIVSFSCDWKTCVFDETCETHGRKVLIPITGNGKKLSVSKVFLESGSVCNMGRDAQHKFASCCPDVKALVLDITYLEDTSNACQSEGRDMLELILEWPKLDELHLNLNLDVNLSKDFLLPILMTKGHSLTSLTLEGPELSSNTMFWFLEHCPNLFHLQVRLWKRSMLVVPNNGEGLKFPKCKLLKELSFHEDGPGYNDSPQAEAGHRRRWCAVLEELLTASPNLHTLSISLCHGLSSFLKSVESNIEVLHLHMKSCYEWNLSIEIIQNLVSHLPNLQYLYLEDLSGTTYWKIWQHYRNTGLKLHWGNLHGWPRTEMVAQE